MTYSDRIKCVVKVDSELLTLCERESLRNVLNAFIKYLTVVACPGHIFDNAPCSQEGCDFQCKCDRCWNQEARG